MSAIISLLFWLVAVPFCIGLIPANFIAAEKRSPGFVLLAGYFGMWALFEISAVPAVLWVEYDNFKTASVVFTVLTLLSAAAGVWLLYRNHKAGKPGVVFVSERTGAVRGKSGTADAAEKAYDRRVGSSGGLKERMAAFGRWLLRGTGIEWLLFFALLGFQLYKAVAYASFDGDDAYYVVESLLAQEAGVMYRILPLTGGSTGIDVRHALAVFPMWIAFVSVRAGIHATVVSHVVMPLVLIPLTYLLYYEIGRALFVRDSLSSGKQADGRRNSARQAQGSSGNVFCRENLPVFMILMAVFQIFGNVSIYTTETFFLTRTWQGKAVAGALAIPAVLWLFLLLCGEKQGKEIDTEKEDRRGLWFAFVCVQMSVGICSSIAVFLVSLLTALTAFVLACVRRDLRLLFKFGAACIPNLIYMAIYVIVAYSYLL